MNFKLGFAHRAMLMAAALSVSACGPASSSGDGAEAAPATDQMAFFKRGMIVTRSHVKISVDLSP